MKNWYKSSYRRSLLDMHIEDWDKEFLSRFDENEIFRNIKKARIRSPMFYIQSHVGYCYWPTVSGHMHRSFKRREDSIRNLFHLCADNGMTPIVYYSLIYNNWAYDAYPEWRMLNVYGKGSRDGGNRYGLCCPNDPGYRAFVSAQIAEFCGYFDFNAIWLDMTFWPMICYCSSCHKRWEEEAESAGNAEAGETGSEFCTSGEMPTIVDWNDPGWNKFQAKREEWIGEFGAFATAEVLKHNPDCTVTHQYSPSLEFWRYGVTENISKASEYASGDFYGGIAEQSFACKMYYGLTQNQPFEYMTSRCYPGLGEHTTNKTMDQLLQSVYTTYAHHGACLLIDGIDPCGTVNPKVYEMIGTAFKETEAYEPYLSKGELVQDVGIYFSQHSKMDAELNGLYTGDRASGNRSMPHLKAALGAAAALRCHHIPVGVVNNWKTDELSNVKVLVLPDVQRFTSEEEKAVCDYVAKGGNLYMSGHSSPKLLEELLGMEYEGKTYETITYIAPTNIGKEYLEDYTAEYPLAILTRQVRLKGKSECCRKTDDTDKPECLVLGTTTLPYTPTPTDKAVGSMSEYCDIKDSDNNQYSAEANQTTQKTAHPAFVSIHSNPPGIVTDHPAIIKTSYGKGSVIWVSAPIEAQERYQHKKIFANLITDLLENQASFGSDNAPEAIEMVMFEDAEAKYLSLINLQDSFRITEVHDFNIRIRMDKSPARVLQLPAGDEIPFSYSDGHVQINIDKLHIFKMLMIVK